MIDADSRCERCPNPAVAGQHSEDRVACAKWQPPLQTRHGHEIGLHLRIHAAVGDAYVFGDGRKLGAGKGILARATRVQKRKKGMAIGRRAL